MLLYKPRTLEDDADYTDQSLSQPVETEEVVDFFISCVVVGLCYLFSRLQCLLHRPSVGIEELVLSWLHQSVYG